MNFMPFFIPSFSLNRFTSTESSNVQESGAQHQVVDSNVQQQAEEESRAQEVVDQGVALGSNHPPSVELHETNAEENGGPSKRGGALQAFSA